jgi:hypothetical protein
MTYIYSESYKILASSPDKAYCTLINENAESIERIWNENGQGKHNGKILMLFDPHGFSNEVLIKPLKVFEVEYKVFFAQLHGIDFGLIPVGVSGLVYKNLSERIFLRGKRSLEVSTYKNHYEFVPSGSLDIEKTPEEQILIELFEEAQLGMEDISSLKFQGFIWDPILPVLDLFFLIKVKPNALALKSAEYSELSFESLNSLTSSINDTAWVPTSICVLKHYVSRHHHF